MKQVSFTLGALLIFAWALPANAGPCSDGRSMVPMTIDAQPDETSPPGQVTILATDLDRGPDTKGTLCVSVGSVGFQVLAPSDDLTPQDALGYKLDVVEPVGAFSLFVMFMGTDYEKPAFFATDGWVWFNFADDPNDSMDWTFRLAAMDQDGNLGDWSEPVLVSHPGKNVGCASVSTGSPLGLCLFLGLFLGFFLMLRSRRHRRL